MKRWMAVFLTLLATPVGAQTPAEHFVTLDVRPVGTVVNDDTQQLLGRSDQQLVLRHLSGTIKLRINPLPDDTHHKPAFVHLHVDPATGACRVLGTDDDPLPGPVYLPAADLATRVRDFYTWHTGIAVGTTAAGLAVMGTLAWLALRRRETLVLVQPEQTLVGRTFDGYRLESLLGEGTFSLVFKATRLERGETVAIKVLRSEYLDAQTSDALRRFHREAMVQLVHRNVVNVYGCGDFLGRPYIVLEYVSGQTLRAMLAPRLPLAEALRIFVQMSRGLAFAHKKGYVHRDLKPENVMVASDGTPKLMDFGIAKHLDKPGATRTATTMGTPRYMSPEHTDSSKTDARSDIYSMGVILFEMLSGRAPFEGDLMELLSAHLYQDPPRLSQVVPSLPASLSDLIDRMLKKQQGDRYQTMDEVLDAVARCCEELQLEVATA